MCIGLILRYLQGSCSLGIWLTTADTLPTDARPRRLR